MKDWNTTRFTKRIALTEEDLEWIKQNKKKKSAAGFLELIIKEYKNGDEKKIALQFEPFVLCK